MKFNKNEFGWKEKVSVNTDELVTKEYVDDSVNTVSENNIFKNTQMNNMLSSLTIGGSLSTGLTKSKTLGEVFPKLLNEEYGVLKQCYVTVEVDGTTKPILTENYNNVLIQLYDNDNNLISSTSLRPKKVGTIYFNANKYMQMAVWFDTTYTEGSGLSHNTPGYVTSLLNITASKNTEEYINAIKDLRISVTLRHTNYLPKDNTVMYEPTSDYNPATKKYVDDKEDKILSLLNNNASIFKITLTDEEMNNLMSTIPGNYSILNSIEPSFIEDIVNNGYWDYNMIMFNDKLLLKINSIGSGGVSCIRDMTIASINFVTINEHYTEFKDLPIVSVLELSLAVIELNGEKKVVFAFGNSREHQLINNYYLDELIKFDSQGNLVVTINGVSKTFVPKK